VEARSRFDAIVIGVGGMGSAAVYHLARRGWSVLGLERFDIPHEMGSSHGVTRIIRLAYYEDPSYVPLLRRAYELWRELEWESGERLLHITGSIDAGPPESLVFAGSVESCRVHGLPYEVLTAGDVNRRFPGYRLPGSAMALLQPDGGFLLPERCIVGHVVAAQRLGAEVHARERVLGWEPDGDGVAVTTDRGRYSADRLVVCAGAWTGGLVPELSALAVPERQVLAWLQPRRPELFQPGRFPVFNLLVDEGRFYGLPVFGVPGLKIGRYHHLGEETDPDTVERGPTSRDERVLRSFVERYFPQGAGPTMALKVCLFTNSPDEHFIIDQLPGSLVVAAGFSGHGYKFCSVVGEILADLCIEGSTRHDINLFRFERFGKRTAGVHPARA
jgi:sarcosine oxidase